MVTLWWSAAFFVITVTPIHGKGLRHAWNILALQQGSYHLWDLRSRFSRVIRGLARHWLSPPLRLTSFEDFIEGLLYPSRAKHFPSMVSTLKGFPISNVLRIATFSEILGHTRVHDSISWNVSYALGSRWASHKGKHPKKFSRFPAICWATPIRLRVGVNPT